MSIELRPGERYRIEHRIGPRAGAYGESTTIIRRGNEVSVDHTDATGNVRRFHATLTAGVYDRIVEHLRNAGFPNAPHELIPPGSTRIVSAIVNGSELRTKPMPYHSAIPEWAALFALFDRIAAQTSSGLAAPRGQESEESVVSGISELGVFKPSEAAEEPPLGEDANEVVAAAWKVAAEHRHREVTPVHLLVAFVRDHGYQLARLGIDPARVLTAGESLFTWDPEPGEARTTPAFELVPQVARRVAAEDGAHEAGLRHLLRAMLEAGGKDVTAVLQKARVPDAMLAGRTKDRIFAMPEVATDKSCSRCGAPAGENRWCLQCGRALMSPIPFASGSSLDHVLPLILPHDFAERSQSVNRSLCSLPDQAGTPWLAFCLEQDGQSSLVTPARMAELGVDAARLEQNAVNNLARIPVSWTPRWVQAPDGHEVDVLFCLGEAHACERILEKPFLLHAQAMLGSNALAASVPQRDMLLLTRLTDLTVLMALSRHYYDNAESMPVSPWGFLIQNGVITGPVSSGG